MLGREEGLVGGDGGRLVVSFFLFSSILFYHPGERYADEDDAIE